MSQKEIIEALDKEVHFVVQDAQHHKKILCF